MLRERSGRCLTCLNPLFPTSVRNSSSSQHQLHTNTLPGSIIMAPKGKNADKGKGKDTGDVKAQKGAQSINVRHILCEKHGKKEEALAKLNSGTKFDEVAREFSEDKARQGMGLVGFSTRGLSCDR